MFGTIIKGIGGFYYVKAQDNSIYECKARGVFRKEKIKPVIGDRVKIEIEKNGYAFITEIENRTSLLIRPNVSNIDTLVIVLSTASPSPDFLLCDKLAVMAQSQNITPVICITKTDIKAGDEIIQAYKNTGYTIFSVCSKNGKGIDEIKAFLQDKTSAFAGLSGSGKSTLLNLLVAEELQTGDISKINRGKHTTRHVELFELTDGGFVLDTPGFSSFEAENVECENLDSLYPEMSKLNGLCRFKGCSHINEPDCAVKDALSRGKISQIRYNNYKNIYECLKNSKQW